MAEPEQDKDHPPTSDRGSDRASQSDSREGAEAEEVGGTSVLADRRGNVLLNEIWKPGFMILAILLLLFVSLVAGGYPSWLMIRFKVVESLKGRISMKRKSGLRSSLIVMQFVIACIMISCTYIIYQQYQYLQNADLGINKAYVISVPLHQPDKGREIIEKLRLRLASNPHIISITGSNINMGRGSDHRTVKSSSDFSYKEKQIHSNFASIDYDYLKTFGLKPIEGRDFDKSFGADTSNNIIISASCCQTIQRKEPDRKIHWSRQQF